MLRRIADLPFFRRLGRALQGVDDAQFGRPEPQDPPVTPSGLDHDDGHRTIQERPGER